VADSLSPKRVLNRSGGWMSAFPGVFDGSLGYIHDRHIVVSAGNQIIDQRGFTTSHVDDRGGTLIGHTFDQGIRKSSSAADTLMV
jgi:hypothetical protein